VESANRGEVRLVAKVSNACTAAAPTGGLHGFFSSASVFAKEMRDFGKQLASGANARLRLIA
jgi:hypothetical protein